MTLFGDELVPVEKPQLSPDRRRTLRQRTAAVNGTHPLALVFGPSIRVHDDLGRSCGNCRFRVLHDYHNRSYPKCVVGDGARVSHSTATDVRAWWPACTDHEWGGPNDWPDAARHVPEETP